MDEFWLIIMTTWTLDEILEWTEYADFVSMKLGI